MTITLIHSYVVRWIGENEVHLPREFLSDINPMAPLQYSGVQFVNRAKDMDFFASLPIAVVPSSVRVDHAAGSISYTISSPFILLAPAPASVYSGNIAVYLFFIPFAHKSCLSSHSITTLYPVWDRSIQLQSPAALNLYTKISALAASLASSQCTHHQQSLSLSLAVVILE